MSYGIKSGLLFFSSIIFLGLLSSCSNLGITLPKTVDWNEHQDNINTYQQWKLQGRLNIRSENRSDTITINWQQSLDSYLINLSGTLGLGAIQIDGNEDGVKVEKAGEAPQFANSLEEISLDYLGFEFPASQLYYWIRGIPAPGEFNIQLNESNLLKTLQQGGWQLNYDRYQEQDNGQYLPGRIKLEHAPYRLTFNIIHW